MNARDRRGGAEAAGRGPQAIRRLYNVFGAFGVAAAASCRAPPATGPSSSPS